MQVYTTDYCWFLFYSIKYGKISLYNCLVLELVSKNIHSFWS